MLSSQPFRIATVLAMLVAVAACGNQGSATNEEAPTDAVESGEPQSSNGGDQAAEDKTMHRGNPDRMNLEEAIEAARKDLAERSGVETGEIQIVQARAVTWRNGALGCPEEGMMYTQALVDGFYIQLSDGDSEHAYHAGRNGKPFFCPAERSQPPLESDQEKPFS